MNPTLFSILALAGYFIYIGWQRRMVVEGNPSPARDQCAGFFETVASIFTVVGAGEYALAISLTAVYGFWGPSLFAGLGFALFAIALVAPRVRKVALSQNAPTTSLDKYPNFTTPDLFYVKYGRSVSVLSTAITVFAFIGILWLQFILGGELIAGLGKISYISAVLILAFVVAIYVCVGRFPAIFHTDTYQGIFMWVTLYLVVGYVFFGNSESASLGIVLSKITEASSSTIASVWSDPTAITIFLSTVIAAFAGPDIWQRITMFQNDTEASRGATLAGVAMLLFILPLLLLAANVFMLPAEELGKEPFVGYTAALGNAKLSVPLWIQIMFALGLLSAFLSTADTAAMLVATAILNEVHRGAAATDCRPPLPVRRVQLIVISVVLLGVFASILAKEPSRLFTGVLAILAAQGLPFLFAIYGRGTKIITLIALIFGAGAALILTFVCPEYNQGYWLLLPFIPGILCVFGRTKEVESE